MTCIKKLKKYFLLFSFSLISVIYASVIVGVDADVNEHETMVKSSFAYTTEDTLIGVRYDVVKANYKYFMAEEYSYSTYYVMLQYKMRFISSSFSYYNNSGNDNGRYILDLGYRKKLNNLENVFGVSQKLEDEDYTVGLFTVNELNLKKKILVDYVYFLFINKLYYDFNNVHYDNANKVSFDSTIGRIAAIVASLMSKSEVDFKSSVYIEHTYTNMKDRNWCLSIGVELGL